MVARMPPVQVDHDRGPTGTACTRSKFCWLVVVAEGTRVRASTRLNNGRRMTSCI